MDCTGAAHALTLSASIQVFLHYPVSEFLSFDV
jgi:hypothetical protein